MLNMLLPPQCLTCDAPVDAPGRFCAACFGRVHFITAPFCVRCATPFAHASEGGPDRVCGNCAENRPPWRQARAALRYDEHSRRVVLPLKYNDRTELAASLAAMMVRAGADLLVGAAVLVPVPLHPSRLRGRRYNQAGLIAREIGRRSRVPTALDALVRLRATDSLGELSAERRAAMVAGAFALRRGRGQRIKGLNVVLIDDVLTSGATASACTRALLAGGAARVDVLVAARVPDPRVR